MRVRLTGLLLAVSMVACGDNDPVRVDDTLSAEEARALVTILVGQTTTSVNSVLEMGPPELLPVPSPARAPFSITQQVEAVDLPCPLGGSMDLSGSTDIAGDTETDNVSVSLYLVAVHQGCVAVDEETGFEVTLTGQPNVTIDLALMVDEATGLDIRGMISGSVLWETPDDRSGSCGIDVDIAVSLNAITGSLAATVGGQVCDDDISETFTLTFGG